MRAGQAFWEHKRGRPPVQIDERPASPPTNPRPCSDSWRLDLRQGGGGLARALSVCRAYFAPLAEAGGMHTHKRCTCRSDYLAGWLVGRSLARSSGTFGSEIFRFGPSLDWGEIKTGPLLWPRPRGNKLFVGQPSDQAGPAWSTLFRPACLARQVAADDAGAHSSSTSANYKGSGLSLRRRHRRPFPNYKLIFITRAAASCRELPLDLAGALIARADPFGRANRRRAARGAARQLGPPRCRRAAGCMQWRRRERVTQSAAS